MKHHRRSSCRVFCSKATVIRVSGIEVSRHTTSKHGRASWANGQLHPLCCPGVQATDDKVTALDDRKWRPAVADHELHVDADVQECLQPFTERLTWTSSSSTNGSPTVVGTQPTALLSSAHLQGKRNSNKAGGKHNLFHRASRPLSPSAP